MVRRLGAVTTALALAVAAGAEAGWTRALPDRREAEVRYVALGDSTVEGVGASSPRTNYVSRLHARLRLVYPRARVVNLGVSGATAADVLDGQLDRAIALAPHLVTLSVGPNDVTRGVPVETFARHVETVFARLARDTRAVVVANLLPDLAVTRRFQGTEHEAAVGRETERFNRALARVARRWGVDVVDLHAPSRVEVPRDPDLLAEDGYHPSDRGYARWAELVWAAVERRLGVR